MSASPAAVRVKEELELDGAGECGASEMAAPCLYAEHEVKDELVLSPERLQPQDIAFTIQQRSMSASPAAVDAKELEWAGASETAAGLYAKHEVKDELVLGPERLQSQDIAFTMQQSVVFRRGRGRGRARRRGRSSGGAGTASKRPSAVEEVCPLSSSPPPPPRCTSPGEQMEMEYVPSSAMFMECGGTPGALSRPPASRDDDTEAALNLETFLKPSPAADAGVLCPWEAPLSGRSRGGQAVLRPCFVKLERILVEEVLHPCTTCHKAFLQDSSLATHKRSYNKRKTCKNVYLNKEANGDLKKPFSCDTCGKRFRVKAYLIVHIGIHTGDKPFSCKICKKQFRQRSGLNAHNTIHTGVKPFSCKICKKQFRLCYTLSIHNKIHTREKPFSCKICKKQFRQRSGLSAHNTIHTGVKPFSCKICKKQFRQCYTLSNHNKIHTGEKPFSCKICKKHFRQSSTLTKHYRLNFTQERNRSLLIFEINSLTVANI